MKQNTKSLNNSFTQLSKSVVLKDANAGKRPFTKKKALIHKNNILPSSSSARSIPRKLDGGQIVPSRRTEKQKEKPFNKKDHKYVPPVINLKTLNKYNIRRKFNDFYLFSKNVHKKIESFAKHMEDLITIMPAIREKMRDLFETLKTKFLSKKGKLENILKDLDEVKSKTFHIVLEISEMKSEKDSFEKETADKMDQLNQYTKRDKELDIQRIYILKHKEELEKRLQERNISIQEKGMEITRVNSTIETRKEDLKKEREYIEMLQSKINFKRKIRGISTEEKV